MINIRCFQRSDDYLTLGLWGCMKNSIITMKTGLKLIYNVILKLNILLIEIEKIFIEKICKYYNI